MVQTILISHDMSKPIALQGFDRLSVMLLAGDGYIEPILIPRRAMTIYANEEQRAQELLINRRATILWSLVAPEMRGLNVAVGGLVIVGSGKAAVV